MASNNPNPIAEFPNVEAKLQQPSKKSAFERQKAEAEAKRQREAAETAAVYQDFVKSFDHDDDDPRAQSSRDGASRATQGGFADRPGALGGSQPAFAGGPGRRHFGVPSGPSMKSGPGSLGPPPMAYGKKRAFDGFQPNPRDRDESRGRLGFDNPDTGSRSIPKAFDASDDESEIKAVERAEEKAISKPTLRLANLPPGTSPAVIRALIPQQLTVENVKILPPSGPGGTERKSMTAIVTLSKETPATDIDAAVSGLQNRYLGYGFYLSLHRHLSSAAITASNLPTVATSTTTSHPFGAKRVAESSLSQGHQPGGYGRGFAPPTSFAPASGGPVNRGSLFHVPAQPPKDIKKLRMIHKTIEAVLEHGPEFEALLMSRPDVQREEKWAWIWDARSEGGVWYRWRMWEIVTGTRSRGGKAKYVPLFEGGHAWKTPEQPLAYEYMTAIHDFVSDSEYNSSDDDDYDNEPNRQAEIGGAHDQEDTFLNPIEKSKLVHLLARLPTTHSKIRKGDIARITAFAITHASRGADEIVDTIVSNIEKPFAYTSASSSQKGAGKDKEGHQDGDSRSPSPAPEEKSNNEAQDISAARLCGLFVVSDILSSSSTSGIRHAWRYRQLFENTLRSRKIFETLGMMAERHQWGRLRAENWKRSVKNILNLWESWCVFPAETHELFADTFENPPQLKKAERAEEGDRQERERKWKTVEAKKAEKPGEAGLAPLPESSADDTAATERMLAAGEPEWDDEWTVAWSDEEWIQDSLGLDRLDGDVLEDPDGAKDGEPVDEDVQMGGTNGSQDKDRPAGGKPEGRPSGGRRRMRAADMFAGSVSEDDV